MAEPVPYSPALPGGTNTFQPTPPGQPGWVQPRPAFTPGQGWGAPPPQASPPIDWASGNFGSSPPSATNPTSAPPYQVGSSFLPPAPQAVDPSVGSWGTPGSVDPQFDLVRQRQQIQQTGKLPQQAPPPTSNDQVMDPEGGYANSGSTGAGRLANSALRLQRGVNNPITLYNTFSSGSTPGVGALADDVVNRTDVLPPHMTWSNLEKTFRNTGLNLIGGLGQPSGPNAGTPVDIPDEVLNSPGFLDEAGFGDAKIHLAELLPVGKATSLVRGATRSLAPMAPMVRRPGLAMVNHDPITGAGAAKNFFGGAKDMAGGFLNHNTAQMATGAYRTGIKAPVQATVPIGVPAAVAASSRPEAKDEVANKYFAPGGRGSGFINSVAALPAITAKSFGMPGVSEEVPTFRQVAEMQMKNLGHAGEMAVEHWPTFKREIGNSSRDLFNQNIRRPVVDTPQDRYGQLSQQYADQFAEHQRMAPAGTAAMGGLFAGNEAINLSAKNDKIRQEVAGLDYLSPTGHLAARPGVHRDAVEAELFQPGRQWTPEQQKQIRGDLERYNPSWLNDDNPTMSYPTKRDMQKARVGFGLEDGAGRQQKFENFNRMVQDDASIIASNAQQIPQAMQPQQSQQPTTQSPQATQPGAQPQQPQPFSPATADMVHKVIAGTMFGPELAVAGSADLAAGGGRAAADLISGVSSNLKSALGAAGGLAVALNAAKAAPTPEAFGAALGMPAVTQPGEARGELSKYWGSLPDSSKILAIAGLSLTAISALRSMFSSGGEDEDDEGFLMKVLPYLGIGAAAWGLGGGTLGFGKENLNLPSMAKYKDLGNAVTGPLGMGNLLN